MLDFTDAILVRLAQPATRASVFTEDSLARILGAGYDVDRLSVEGPYSAVFEELELGVDLASPMIAAGTWQPEAGGPRVEARFEITGLAGTPAVRANAAWNGSIVARGAVAQDRIEAAEVRFPDLDTVDASIVADLGALPNDPGTLEAERRSRVLDRLRGVLAEASALTDARFDDWIADLGYESVGGLLAESTRVSTIGGLRVRFAPPVEPPPAPLPITLPISATIFVRGEGFSVSELLHHSREAEAAMRRLGLQRPVEAALPRRRGRDHVVVWIVPETVFDESWPGGSTTGTEAEKRARRIEAAGEWLSEQGIGLVPTSTE